MNAVPPGSASEAACPAPSRPPPAAWPSLLACGLVLGGAAAAVFLAGGPSQGSLGVFLVCAGLALVACPPQRRLPWTLWVAAVALLGCGALSFLPERWFGVPAWRQALEAGPAIHLPGTVTPVPWATGFWLGVSGVSLLTGFLLLTHPLRSPVSLLFALCVVAVCGVYAGLAIYAKRSGWHYPFDGGATFGFFPNRNHTATLLMTGSLAALGVLAVTLRDGRWPEAVLAGVGLTLCLVALFFFSTSRGAILFLVMGVAAWIAGLGRANRSPRLLVSVGVLGVAAVGLLWVSGSTVSGRLRSLGATPPPAPVQVATSAPEDPASAQSGVAAGETPLDFRVLIWRDARRMVGDFPLTGSGLGTFADEFGQYRRASLTDAAALHPESDWLMLAAEVGLPAAAGAAVLVLLVARRLTGPSTHPFWPLRWALAVAAGAAVLHGAVDVPLHRVALGWWVLAVGGLALQAGSGRQWDRSPWQHVLFILGGLGALALGGQLIRAEWFGGKALPPFAAERAPTELVGMFQRQPFEAMQMAGQAAHASPLSAPLYHLWGVMLLHFEDSDREVEEAFRAERLLNPNRSEIPFRQGDAWAAVNPKQTAALWLEGVERRRAIQLKGTSIPDEPEALFAALLERARRFPGVAAELAPAAARSPAYTLAWINGAEPATVQEKLGQIVATEGLLAKFSPVERQRLLLAWEAKGNPEALAAFLAEHADWQEAAIPLRLRQIVRAGRYEEAVRTGAASYGISLALPIPDGTQPTPGAPDDPADPLAGFNRYWREGNPVTARRILAEAEADADTRPWAAEYWRLRTAVAAQDRTWPQAWNCLRRAVRCARPEEVLP